jgi:hypothetical protein
MFLCPIDASFNMLKFLFIITVGFSALCASDEQNISSLKTRRSSSYSHFDSASTEMADKKRVKFRLGASSLNMKVSKVDRQAFSSQAAALLLGAHLLEQSQVKHLKKKNDISVEAVEITDEARQPLFLQEVVYNPLSAHNAK